jgi:hypothetical protein
VVDTINLVDKVNMGEMGEMVDLDYCTTGRRCLCLALPRRFRPALREGDIDCVGLGLRRLIVRVDLRGLGIRMAHPVLERS